MGLQCCGCIAFDWFFVVLASSQNLFLYRLSCRIQPSSIQWLRLTGALALPGSRSAKLTISPTCLLESFLADQFFHIAVLMLRYIPFTRTQDING